MSAGGWIVLATSHAVPPCINLLLSFNDHFGKNDSSPSSTTPTGCLLRIISILFSVVGSSSVIGGKVGTSANTFSLAIVFLLSAFSLLFLFRKKDSLERLSIKGWLSALTSFYSWYGFLYFGLLLLFVFSFHLCWFQVFLFI